MPIYEYECQECGYRHEALQKISDDPLTDCPSCGASALRKLVSAAGFRLSGSGWYETDFKNKGQAADSPAKSAGGEKPAASSASGSSAKAADA